jgi:hypothetical protein
MLKLSIFKDGTLTNEATFSTQLELDAFVARHEEMETFLLSDKTIVIKMIGEEDIVTIKPATHTFTVEDISSQVEAEVAKQAKIEAGKAAREVCQQVLDYVAGANLDGNLTIEQITDLQQTFSQAETALRSGRPSFAKYFILQIEPDGILVTEELKATCLELLAGY